MARRPNVFQDRCRQPLGYLSAQSNRAARAYLARGGSSKYPAPPANEEENLRAAEARIVDTDFAVETAELAKNLLLEQTAIEVIKQGRVQNELVLVLIEAATES
jgi:hypothetical protein